MSRTSPSCTSPRECRMTWLEMISISPGWKMCCRWNLGSSARAAKVLQPPIHVSFCTSQDTDRSTAWSMLTALSLGSRCQSFSLCICTALQRTAIHSLVVSYNKPHSKDSFCYPKTLHLQAASCFAQCKERGMGVRYGCGKQ